METVQILDRQGQERDWDWLVTQFGPLHLERAGAAEGNAYRIVKLQDSEGPAVQVVHVAGPDGQPKESVQVVRFWPDAPALPAWAPPISLWRRQGVFGKTNAAGDIGYGMGHGDYYSPPSSGASAVWVADPSGPSDFISGLGMLGGTPHRHLDVHFQLQAASAPPEEPPFESPDEPEEGPTDGDDRERWQQLFAKLDKIIAMLEEQPPR